MPDSPPLRGSLDATPSRATPETLLERIIASHDAALWRIARVYAGTTGEAEDLRQEILLRIWRALPTYRGEATLGTWAFRVALNTALTWKRRARRADRREAHVATEPVTSGAPRDTDAVLTEFLAALGPVDRTTLLLYMEGLGGAEIGDVLGMTSNAVGVRLHRLKDRFSRNHVEE